VGAPTAADPAHYGGASAPAHEETINPTYQPPAMSAPPTSESAARAGGGKADPGSNKSASAPPTPLPRPVAAVAVPVTHEMAIAQPYDGEVEE